MLRRPLKPCLRAGVAATLLSFPSHSLASPPHPPLSLPSFPIHTFIPSPSLTPISCVARARSTANVVQTQECAAAARELREHLGRLAASHDEVPSRNALSSIILAFSPPLPLPASSPSTDCRLPLSVANHVRRRYAQPSVTCHRARPTRIAARPSIARCCCFAIPSS